MLMDMDINKMIITERKKRMMIMNIMKAKMKRMKMILNRNNILIIKIEMKNKRMIMKAKIMKKVIFL
jgi:hypothetical protein